MKRLVLLLVSFTLVLLPFVRLGLSHCEIPCGIYDDKIRMALIEEHITTIEKSMQQIEELSQESNKNHNQIVRWVNNKEIHAQNIQNIVTQYFMTQRVKPVDKTKTKVYNQYVKQITLLHQMLVVAMKSKQTTDLAHTTKLKSLAIDFKKAYFNQGND